MKFALLLLGLGLLFVRASFAADRVTLVDQGKDVVLSNGIVSATISKSGASISSMKFRGFEMLNAGYYSMDGGENYRTPQGCIYSVKSNTPDMVDIGMKRVWKKEPQPFDIEAHYVLRRGDSGIYCYAILDHPASYPAGGYGEWRFVWKLSNELLEKIYVDDKRHWQMPSADDYKKAEKTPIKEITKLTTGPWAGKYDCKYDYSTEYWQTPCWGHASDKNKVGAWIVLGGEEFFNDGPTKQDLNAASGINHIHFGMNHYNGSSAHLAAGQAWNKMYGPFLLYCNYNSQGGDALWADAKARSEKEHAAWPYAWLTDNPNYPLAAARGNITGTFAVRDPLKKDLMSKNAWIGLAQPAPGENWQFESMNYQFWSRVGEDGKFQIKNIRPGKYTLYAFLDGAVGEFSKQDVTVTAGKLVSLGELVWNIPHKGRSIAWEIGVPDRTAKEFRHGDDYFHGYMWKNFTSEWPNPLEYFIGKSDWSKDWNYAQSRVGPDDKPVPHQWRIHFNLAEVPTGDPTLTLAIASAQRARINIDVNDNGRPIECTPSVQGGNALLRESIHAKYCVEYVTIPANRLRKGENMIELSIANVSGADHHVMYDYLNLELP